MSDIPDNDRAYRLVTRYLAPLIIIASLALILYSTLKPFDFDFSQVTPASFVRGYVLPPSSFLDFVRNIVLFMPLGFGLAALLTGRDWPERRVLFTVILAGFLLTLAVETLQNFLGDRQPSLTDLFCNTLGAYVGLVTFRLWQDRPTVSRQVSRILARPVPILLGVTGYLLLIAMLTASLARSVQFAEWSLSDRLALGNELTADRPWSGALSDVLLLDRALSGVDAQRLLEEPGYAAESGQRVLVYYPLRGDDALHDQTGVQPDLIPQANGRAASSGAEGNLSAERWLATEIAVTNLSAAIEDSSEATIRLTLATDNLDQYGPARILTISVDPHERNLTVGQVGDGLIVRFRTPFSGENGARPEILFPGFFAGTGRQDALISINGRSLTVLSGAADEPTTVRLLPGLAFYRYLNPFINLSWRISAGSFALVAYEFLFYALFFMPLGMLPALPQIRVWPLAARLILLALCLVVAPLLIEAILTTVSGQTPVPLNVLISLLFVALGAALTAALVRYLKPPDAH